MKRSLISLNINQGKKRKHWTISTQKPEWDVWRVHQLLIQLLKCVWMFRRQQWCPIVFLSVYQSVEEKKYLLHCHRLKSNNHVRSFDHFNCRKCPPKKSSFLLHQTLSLHRCCSSESMISEILIDYWSNSLLSKLSF